MIPLITIEGATASGKSALALQLAHELGAQIISADSRQIYRHMDIGTAKPTAEDRAQVTHHLIDIIDPDQSYNAGFFCKDAEAIIQDLHEKGIPSIVCGGTGLYVGSLLRGLFELPPIDSSIREKLKERMEEHGQDSLYRDLQKIDPGFAHSISSHDKQRILRGMEVFLGTGKTISAHWQEQQSPSRYDTFRILIDPPRELLYDRINKRMRQMVDSGLLEEIKKLLSMGFSGSSPGLNSLGYKEFLPYLQSGLELDVCLDNAAQHSRNYAKRQATWYRKHKFDLTITDDSISISTIKRSIAGRFPGLA